MKSTIAAGSGLLFWWLTGGRIASEMSANGAVAAAKSGREAAPPGVASMSIAGRVTFGDCGSGPAAGALLTLDGRFTVRTDDDGRYRFDGVPAGQVPGLPEDHHVLTAIAATARTKIIRVTPTSCASPCAALDFTMRKTAGPACDAPSKANSIDAADATAGAVVDRDQDLIDDLIEDWLAERFAPIVHHGQSETNYPVSVDWLLKRTSLREYGSAGPPEGREVWPTADDQAALLNRTLRAADGKTLDSDGTRSVCKRSGYFLADVGTSDRVGQRDDPRSWITYVHAYGNGAGGVTIQYWRAYAYDESKVLFVDWGHGGDWEGIAVHLDAALRPETVGLLGHLGIDQQPATEIAWEGTHPLIWSEEGGHASRKAASDLKSRRFTRQETWNGGTVIWWDGRRNAGGGLLNVGEKRSPLNGQVFIQYSGLWGSPHRLFLTSGYWGPAFNETGAVCDDGRPAYRMSIGCGVRSDCQRIVHTAWCAGMDGALLDLNRECRAQRSSP